MSAAAGFVCADGIVLSADADAASGVARWEPRRILVQARGAYLAAVSGCGNHDLIRMAADQLARDLDEDDDLEGLWRTSEKLVNRLAKKYLFCYAEHDPERPQLQLLIAFRHETEGSLLLASDANRIARVDGCTFVGAGAELARATSSWLYEPSLPCAVVAPLAAQLLAWVRENVSGCGPTGRILSLEPGGAVELEPPAVPGTDFFGGVHRLLQPILAGCVDGRLSDVEFDDRLRWFEESMSALRLALKRGEPLPQPPRHHLPRD